MSVLDAVDGWLHDSKEPMIEVRLANQCYASPHM